MRARGYPAAASYWTAALLRQEIADSDRLAPSRPAPHPTVITATASSDSISTLAISRRAVAGRVRQRAILSARDRPASKNSGS